ncbi:hypothetical protein FRC11_013151, partial [Ceratobasidium sp. 423]
TATVEGRRHPPPSEGYTYKSMLLGGGPVIHLNRLENLWADRIIYTYHWRGLVSDLIEKWSMITAGAGVMWASNVGFVASPSVDMHKSVPHGIYQPINAFEDLRKRGYTDITAQLDLPQCSEYPFKLGGSGEIYSGKVSGTSTFLAIKIARWTKNLTDDEKFKSLKHTLHQALVWSMCKHPNVHQFLAVAEYRDRFALISPLMANGDLRQFLSLGSHSQARLYGMCSQICVGIAYLHELGITHGDIKAQNILVSDDLVLKIMDFGNARFEGLDSLVAHLLAQVSLHWAPREMLEENPKPTIQADIHSLGMTLLEVTSRSVPYARISERVVLLNILKGVLPSRHDTPLQSWNEPEDLLWALLARCWTLDPQDRPAAAAVRDQMRLISSQMPEALRLYA